MAAQCGQVQIKAEPHSVNNNNHNDARLSALIIEAQLYQQVQAQSLQLKRFKKNVQKRLKDSKYISKTGATKEDETVVRIEKHVHDNIESDPLTATSHPLHSSTDVHHDITIINCKRERQSCIDQMLSLSEKPRDDVISCDQSDCTMLRNNDELFQLKPDVIVRKPKVQINDTLKTDNKLEMSRKAELAAHHLTTRRMYSALERQQSRVNALNRHQQRGAEKRRQEREEERRMVESQYPSAITSEERQKGVQWLEMIALERREQKLTKQKDTQRFCEALQFILHEKHPFLPSLCPCHRTVWETDPNKCAVNCPFYRNHTKFAKELSLLLQSINCSK